MSTSQENNPLTNKASTPIQSNSVSAREVSQNLKDADDPLEFIRANRRPAPEANIYPTATSDQIVQGMTGQAVMVEQKAPPVTPLEQMSDTAKDLVNSAMTQLKQEVSVGEPKTPENDLLKEAFGKDKVEVTPEESLKDFRRKTTKLQNEIKERDALLESTRIELESYKKGEAIPEVVQQKDERIKELEQYEKLHNLRMSSEYQQKFAEPLESAKQKALTIANDYSVDPQIFNEALQIENKRELNAYLRNHFDELGAIEARDAITEIRKISSEADRAEAEPQQALDRIREEYRVRNVEQENTRIRGIELNTRDGWMEGLSELQQTGDYPEFAITGDEKQDQVVRSILEAAAQEYGKAAHLLAAAGTKNLPKELTKMLAKRFLLSQASSIMAASRAQHYRRSEDILNEKRRESSLIRPQIGGVTNGTPSAPPKARTMDEAANILINKALQGR